MKQMRRYCRASIVSVAVGMLPSVVLSAEYSINSDCAPVAHEYDKRADVDYKPEQDVDASVEDALADREKQKEAQIQLELSTSLQDKLDPRKYNYPKGNETRFPYANVTMNRDGIFQTETKMDDFTASAMEERRQRDCLHTSKK